MANLFDEGAVTPGESQTNTKKIIPYLQKHNLPIENFAINGITIQDLENFDVADFEGFCKDLQLNTVNKIRFRKLIKELNQTNAQFDIKQNVENQVKAQQLKIIQTFNLINEQLNQRKQSLLQELQRISDLSIYNLEQSNDQTSINIEFVADENLLKQTISNFGVIYKNKKVTTAPIITASIQNNNCIKITLKENNINKEQNNNILMVEYKAFEMDSKMNDEIQDWKSINNINSSVINNIQPLTTYCIRARLKSLNTLSPYSKTIRITTNVDCVWNKTRNIMKNNTVRIINNRKLIFSSQCETLTVVSKPTLNADLFKSIKFEFIITEYCQNSMFGFVAACAPVKQVMNGFWKKQSIAKNKNAFILETMCGLKCIHRHKNGKDLEMTFLSNPGIVLSQTIKKGDHFIFDVDFDQCSCTVKINKNGQIIKGKNDVATWTNIPRQIVAVYGHCVGSKLIKKQSVVEIKLLSCTMR
eukprot:78679_1